jgi:hypothetical protein
VFGEVPGEAPTADLSIQSEQVSPPEESPPPDAPTAPAPHEEPVAAAEPVLTPQEPAPQEPTFQQPTPDPPEPVVSKEEEAAMPASDPAPQPTPLAGPDAQTVAGDGFGPSPEALPDQPFGEQSWWERPEVVVGAAFACGLVLAALLRRRRS